MSEVEVSSGTSTVSDKQSKERQELIESRLLSSQFGNMVTIMMQSPHHKDVRLPELRRRLVPPLLTKQFRLAEARKKNSGTTIPVGLIIWARVSDEVHDRMLKQLDRPFDLDEKEWTGGHNYWIIDVVGPDRFVAPLLSELRRSDFKEKTVHYRSRTPDGPEVRTMTPNGDAADKVEDTDPAAAPGGGATPPNSGLNGQHAAK